jgi:hypothetical protein
MSRVIRLALVFYLPMLAGGFWLRPPGVLRVGDWHRTLYSLSAAVIAILLLVQLSRWSSRRFDWGERLKEEFRQALGPLSSREILWLSLLSGFGEEILFRGVLLSHAGLLASSALFGALHFPIRRSLWPWTVFATALGFSLAVLTVWAGSLWPAILIHLCVNYFNLHDIVASLPEPDA